MDKPENKLMKALRPRKVLYCTHTEDPKNRDKFDVKQQSSEPNPIGEEEEETHRPQQRHGVRSEKRRKQRGKVVSAILQSDQLSQQLLCGAYKYMMCCESVRERHKVWSCCSCFRSSTSDVCIAGPSHQLQQSMKVLNNLFSLLCNDIHVHVVLYFLFVSSSHSPILTLSFFLSSPLPTDQLELGWQCSTSASVAK